MKKIRITPKANGPGKSLLLFPNSIATYCWLVDQDQQSEKNNSLFLQPGSYIEAQWCGCEFVYDGPEHYCLYFIKLIKLSTNEKNEIMLVPFYGWTISSEFPFYTCEDALIDVKLLTSADEQYDIDEIFKNFNIEIS